MSKRFLMISIAIFILITAAGTAYYTYRSNAERVLKFRSWMNNPPPTPAGNWPPVRNAMKWTMTKKDRNYIRKIREPFE